MSAHRKLFPLLITILVTSSFIRVAAQEEVSWLKDYTDEMTIGNDTYRYRFTSVDGNECKVKIEEQVTDRKGSVEMHSWIFYLSDIDPAALRFNARGKSIEVNLETRNSQEFISYYEEGEFEEYTDQIELTMNEVDMKQHSAGSWKISGRPWMMMCSGNRFFHGEAVPTWPGCPQNRSMTKEKRNLSNTCLI